MSTRDVNEDWRIAMSMLHGKEILLGVSGSIAAYKAAELARLLSKAGAKVQVLLTKSACEFIAPLTFFSLTGREAFSEMYSGGSEVATAHIALVRRADLVLIAPATARTIARIAQGSPDDLLSTAVIAASCPVVVAPAMNVQMYKHPAVQENVAKLASWPHYTIAAPGAGEMACGEYGLGRLSEPSQLVEVCEWVLGGGETDLIGEHVVVTAGPTYEDVDPVRFLSNRSSGKMGFAIAQQAARRGARVTLISAVTHLPLPPGCQLVPVRSAASMADAVHYSLSDCSVLVMAAAVADYKPVQQHNQKMKKQEGDLSIPLARTQDILASLPADEKRITVGFAAETQDVLHYAAGKMKKKRLDMIVANDVTQAGSGFGTDTNQVTLLFPEKEASSLAMMSKVQVADQILDQVRRIRTEKDS